MSPLVRRCLTAAAVCVTAFSLIATSADSASTSTAMVRIGTAPVLPAGTQPLAAAASNQSLRVTVALAPRDAAALAAYATAVSEPGSAQYGRFLSTAQFAARFGPSTATIDAVTRSLAARGITGWKLAANRLSLQVEAPVGMLESAFDTELARVLLPKQGSALVDIQAPAVTAAIAPDVQAVIGLDGLQTMRSSLVRPRTAGGATASPGSTAHAAPAATKRQAPTPCAAATAAAPGQDAYTANQIANAYSFNGLYSAGDEGAGVSIGVYELEPNLTSDIATYQACYGTDAPISYVPVDGGAGSGVGSGEAAFDIEQVIGLAPKANIIVYQAPNSNSDGPGAGPYDLFSAIISANAVKVVTNSWGECEAVEGRADADAEETLFEEAAVQGMTIVSAAGDDGSEDCDGATPVPDESLAVDDPGSQQWVTSAGGTSLTSAANPPTEVVWNNGGGGNLLGVGSGPGAGGGGISSFWPMPTYQSAAPASVHVINGGSSGAPCGNTGGYCREVPDVAADADPEHGYLIYYNGTDSDTREPSGWQGTGGTSGAAPLWAALFALADASKGCSAGPLGFVNPALYGAAAAGAYFHDITSGNNDYTGTNKGLYPAGVGFDEATGLGSPDGLALTEELCDESLRVATPAPQATQVGTGVKVTPSYAAPSSTSIAFSATGLPAGLGVNAADGVISGKPTRAGNYEVTLTATDSANGVRSVRFSWRIQAPPSIVHLSLAAVRTGRPTLTFRVNAGSYEPTLSSLVISLPGGISVARGSQIAVESSGHTLLSHTASASGHRVGVTLKTPARSFLLVFKRGSLASTPSTAAAAVKRPRPRLDLAFAVKDTGRLSDTLRTTVTPTS